MREYGNMYRGIILTFAQIISECKVNVECSRIQKIPSVRRFLRKKRSLATVQVFILKVCHTPVGVFFFFWSNAKSRCKYFNHFSHTFPFETMNNTMPDANLFELV